MMVGSRPGDAAHDGGQGDARRRGQTGSVASLMGINVNAVMIGAFVLSSALAGVAASCIAPIAHASLFMGLTIALKGFSGAIIGGLNNPRGCVIGGFVLGRARIAGQPLAGPVARDRGLRCS